MTLIFRAVQSQPFSALALAITLFFFSLPAARAGWPTQFMLPSDFYSTDPAPIEVVLRTPNDTEETHKVTLHVPRAAIVFANGYSGRSLPKLPDNVVTNEIIVAVVYPDGEPLSVKATEIATQRKVSLTTAIEGLRLRQYTAQLHYSGPNRIWEELTQQSREQFKIVDSYDGLQHAPADYYFGEDGVDVFRRSYCYPEATSIYFCKTEMRAGPGLTASVDFPDFRLHGGRAYLNERVHKFREIVCRYSDPPC
jgi:hypothetical protein